jgi:hypothetical protein
MNTTTIGLDIAKRVFQAHGTDARGKSTLTRRLKRAEVLRFFANLQPCLIGIEACASAHHWARKLCELGHTVKLIAPQFVKPYVKTNKNDARDAEAICEAVSRPNMRFVPMKTVEQQATLALHRARQGFVSARTAQSNQPGQTGVDESCQVQGTSKVRRFDQASTSSFHQGPRPSAVHRGRMYGCNLDLLQPERTNAWQLGGVHV